MRYNLKWKNKHMTNFSMYHPVFYDFREIEYTKCITKNRIVAELEKAVDFNDQVEVAELIAEFTLPVQESKQPVPKFSS